MKKIISFILLLFLIFYTVTGCKNKKPDIAELLIIQTTDVHGTIFPFDFIENKPTNHSLSAIYSMIKRERLLYRDAVVLLDNGDYLQGQPTVYYYNFVDTTSLHLAAQVMNYMSYDAASVGNHDLETGHPVYDRYRKQLTMPYLAANVLHKTSGEPYFQPYAVIERQGIKIAVLGLTTPGISNWLPQNLWSGMVVSDMVETAKKWIPIIQDNEAPDLIIGLFHSGVDAEMGTNPQSEFMEENASRLVAEKVAGFDLILAGHDHQKHIEKVINPLGDTVILLDAQSHSKSVSKIKVKFQLNSKTHKYDKTYVAEIIDVENEPADSLFMKTFSEQFEAVKKFCSTPLGEFTQVVDSKDAYFGNSAFIDLVHQVQLDVTGADLSFTDPLSYRTEIDKGSVFVSDLFKLYKFENTLYTLSLTGNEIDKYLEFSYALWFNQMREKTDHLLRLKQIENGNLTLDQPYYNFSSAAGIEYLVDVSKPEGNKVHILGLSSGAPFYSDSTYTVALNSYRGSGGGGHLTKGAGLSAEELLTRKIASSEFDMRYYLRKWIEDKRVITPKKGTNWRIIPEEYFELGKQKDRELLFGK